MKAPILVWLQHDLRLSDNPALHEAAKTGAPVIPIYVYDLSLPWNLNDRQLWWLARSLEELPIVFRKGKTDATLKALIKETGAQAIYTNRSYTPFWHPHGAQVFPGNLLFEPEAISNKQGDPFLVFTPFWKTCRQLLTFEKPLPPPNISQPDIPSDPLPDGHPLPDHWQPGEQAAWKKLKAFTVKDYSTKRDLPATAATSKLSPHLHFGEISPRQIAYYLKDHPDTHDREKFLAEVGWREFSYHLLTHFPHITEKAFDSRFDNFSWQQNKKLLTLWQKGETGYPIVDAGMRELMETGWMHNRVRMIVASFLTKHLNIHWHSGAEWFWDTLVDADLANNSASWQWVAGCGADAAPYFRIFNPILQGQKFDPQGTYIKHWVPELADVPLKHLNTPWEVAPPNYPPPLVDHQQARQDTLNRFKNDVH